MEHPLKRYIERYITISNEEFELFIQSLISKTYKKKEYLLSAREVCKKRFFVLDGLVRTYYIDQEGNEKITVFGKEHWWVTDMESLVNQVPSRVYIQALEETTVLEITSDKLEELFSKLPKLERLFRIITEKWLIAQQRSSHFYMKASSKDRYDSLVENIPNFLQRVPQYMIASYLDITPEHLSTLRKPTRNNAS